MSDRDERRLTEDDARAGNPSAESDQGLAGDMGISSERTGPYRGVENTGTLASAQGRTDGASDMTPGPLEPIDEVHRQAQQAEENPADVPNHVSDPTRNPGHSHG